MKMMTVRSMHTPSFDYNGDALSPGLITFMAPLCSMSCLQRPERVVEVVGWGGGVMLWKRPHRVTVSGSCFLNLISSSSHVNPNCLSQAILYYQQFSKHHLTWFFSTNKKISKIFKRISSKSFLWRC